MRFDAHDKECDMKNKSNISYLFCFLPLAVAHVIDAIWPNSTVVTYVSFFLAGLTLVICLIYILRFRKEKAARAADSDETDEKTDGFDHR